MSHTIFMAYAGLRSRSEALEVTANNLANATTVGFKQDRSYFNIFDRLQKEGTSEMEQSINGPVVGLKTAVDFAAGNFVQTENPLHVALVGRGFFAVETPEGVRYTRNGSFSRSGAGEIVTSQGFRVLSETGGNSPQPLRPPDGNIAISSTGDVSVDGAMVGRLKIVDFSDPSILEKQGSNLFAAPEGVETVPPPRLEVRQGHLEQANVNTVEAVTQMISLLRSFELLSQTIRQISNNVDRKVIDEVARF